MSIVPHPSRPQEPDALGAADVVERLLQAWVDPAFIAEWDGQIRSTNSAFRAWAGVHGLPDPQTLSQILTFRTEDLGLIDGLWDDLRDGRTWTGKRRFLQGGGSQRTFRLRVSPMAGGPWGAPFLVVQFLDLTADLEEVGAEADRQRTNLLLDLLGATVSELEAPVESLRWLAGLTDSDLLQLPGRLGVGLRGARRGARRLTEMFHHVKVGATETAPEPATQEVLARVLLTRAEPWQAAKLLDQLHASGLRCILRVVSDPADVALAVARGETDAVMVGGGDGGALDGDLAKRLRAEHAGVPVFDLRQKNGKALGRAIRDAVRSRLRQDSASAAWRRMEEVSLRDPLTGVLNRRAFERFAQAEFRRAQRYGIPLSLAGLDPHPLQDLHQPPGPPFRDPGSFPLPPVLSSSPPASHLVCRPGRREFCTPVPLTHGA
ncbi:MAG: hypothetical protein H8E31_09070, partial [Planctomycetes bacterium]|nr:hypothetical protein [Planctomycetota bacterium]